MCARSERTHGGGDVFLHLEVGNFVLGLPPAQLIGSGWAAAARPLVISPLLGCCGNLKQTKTQKQKQESGDTTGQCSSNVWMALDTSRIDSQINRAPIL